MTFGRAALIELCDAAGLDPKPHDSAEYLFQLLLGWIRGSRQVIRSQVDPGERAYQETRAAIRGGP